MVSGIIVKALSGFYYVRTQDGELECKARGKFRLDGTSPLVGDRVLCSADEDGRGRIDSVLERKNFFIRPPVANIDALVFVAANANPITDPFLIDRVSVIAQEADCALILCVNKTDLDGAEELCGIYERSGFTVVRASAETGEGVEQLRTALLGRVCAFTGNSGVGKSSLLNRLLPCAHIETAPVSERLGRGKHTTRHTQLYTVAEDTYIADTPGFASFDIAMMSAIPKERMAELFPDFSEHIGRCRFSDCAHLKEPGCTVTQAVKSGEVSESRYDSYVRLYGLAAKNEPW